MDARHLLQYLAALFFALLLLSCGESDIERMVSEPPILEVVNDVELEQPIVTPISELDLSIDRTRYLKSLVREVTKDASADEAISIAWLTWLQNRIAHPKSPPMHDQTTMIVDPIWIIENRVGQCGQTNRVLVDGLEAIGIQARLVQLSHHIAAEAYWDGQWHYLDADWLHNGQTVRRPDGAIPSAKEIAANTHWLDTLTPVSEYEAYPVDVSNSPELFGDPVGWYKKGFNGAQVGTRKTPYFLKKTADEDELGDYRYGWHLYAVIE